MLHPPPQKNMLVLWWIETDRKKKGWWEGGSTERKKRGEKPPLITVKEALGKEEMKKKALNGMTNLFACYLRGRALYDGGYKDVRRLRQFPWGISIKRGKKF